MRIPPSAERLKEVPAQALRAVRAKEAPAQQALRAVLSRQAPGQALRAVLSREAPAQAMRAVFSGVGQVLLVTERVRRRAMGEDRETAAPADVPATPAAETTPAAVAAPAAGTAPAAKAGPATASTAKPAAVKKAGAGESTAAPPIPHYSELSVPSLRARMRGLDTAQLRELVSYERAHEGRETVIAMFERRIAKLETEGPAAG